MKKIFKGIRKKGQGNKFINEDIKRHPEGDNPKDLSTPGSRFSALHARIKRIRLRLSLLVRLRMTAFTLAEVLITLGIIGIVAAMTIPTLISDYQKKQTVTKLQKAISVLNQAYKLSYDDVGEPTAEESFQMGAVTYFNTYWAPYIKVSLMCTTYNQCGYNEAAPWFYPDGNKASTSVVIPDRRATFYTPDGFLYVIFTASGLSDSLSANHLVYVDINGGQGPNKFGRDVFILERVQTDGGGIQPYGRNFTDHVINSNCSKAHTSDVCAEKIRRAGWKIEKNYPWN